MQRAGRTEQASSAGRRGAEEAGEGGGGRPVKSRQDSTLRAPGEKEPEGQNVLPAEERYLDHPPRVGVKRRQEASALEMHPSWSLAQMAARPGAGSRSTCTPRTRTRACPR